MRQIRSSTTPAEPPARTANLWTVEFRTPLTPPPQRRPKTVRRDLAARGVLAAEPEV